MYHATDANGHSDFKPWWELDLARQWVPHSIINLVCNSELNSFNMNYPRAGVVVYHDCMMLTFIHDLVKWDVPMWIYWGNVEGSLYGYNTQFFKFSPPTQGEIDQCAKGQIPRLSDGMGTDKAEGKMTLCGYATEQTTKRSPKDPELLLGPWTPHHLTWI